MWQISSLSLTTLLATTSWQKEHLNYKLIRFKMHTQKIISLFFKKILSVIFSRFHSFSQGHEKSLWYAALYGDGGCSWEQPLMHAGKGFLVWNTGHNAGNLLSNQDFCCWTRQNTIIECHYITRWSRDQMNAIVQTTFSNVISCMKIVTFRFKVHWNLLANFQLRIFQHWSRKRLDADQVTSHNLDQWWPGLLTHTCVTRYHWYKYCQFRILEDKRVWITVVDYRAVHGRIH